MPDLSNKGSHEFWQEYPDSNVYRVIAMMEGVENWTLDGKPEIETVMTELGEVLDNIGNVDLQEEEKFIQLSYGLKAGRSFRLLQCINVAHPGAASKILAHAESISESPNSIPGVFLQRNMEFERLRLLSRIFSEDRFYTVSLSLEGEDNSE